MTTATIGLIVVLMASVMTIGADTMWLVALGDWILHHAGIPAGVPFAAADSSRWVNLPALAEVLFAGLHAASSAGIPVAQLVADTIALTLLALGAKRLGAGGMATSCVILASAAGSLPALGVVRAQLLSLVPFAILLLLLRSEQVRPTRRIWWLVPLVAIWGNLHGAVLAGVALTGSYLVFSRLVVDPWRASAVGVAVLAALFVNPVNVHTPSYYASVLQNEAASRGTELWAPLNIHRPFDVLLIGAGLVLVTLTLVIRRPVWEYLAIAALTVATVTSARHGLWLVFFCTAPAAAGLSELTSGFRMPPVGRGRTHRSRLSAAVACMAAIGSIATVSARAGSFGSDQAVADAIARVAQGNVVLATSPIAENLAVSGVRVWLSNPIDAFSREDQSAYLDFVSGQGPHIQRALDSADLVVALADSPSALLAEQSGWVAVKRVGRYDVLARR